MSLLGTGCPLQQSRDSSADAHTPATCQCVQKRKQTSKAWMTWLPAPLEVKSEPLPGHSSLLGALRLNLAFSHTEETRHQDRGVKRSESIAAH